MVVRAAMVRDGSTQIEEIEFDETRNPYFVAQDLLRTSVERVRTPFPDLHMFVDEQFLYKPELRPNRLGMCFYPGEIRGTVIFVALEEVMTHEGLDLMAVDLDMSLLSTR